jgi:tRNA pseudouridine55 synthase
LSTRDGFLLIDKPRGVSSFSIVRSIRSVLSISKAGHAGTLDPAADGLLVLAFGKATRLIQYLPLDPKVYEFTVQFGAATDTLDADGAVVQSGGNRPAAAELAALLPVFTGKQLQVPPVYSALKIGGRRSYDLARKGIPAELQPREITIFDITLQHYDELAGTASVAITCSAGTYVRALARDIAGRLSTIGFAAAIRRIRCGAFSVHDALAPERVGATTQLIPPARAFASQPGVQASGAMLQNIIHGRDVSLQQVPRVDSDRIMAYHDDELVAVLRKIEEMRFHPDLVLTSTVEVEHAGT